MVALRARWDSAPGVRFPCTGASAGRQHVAAGRGASTSRDKMLLLAGTTKPGSDGTSSLGGTEMKKLRCEELKYFITDFALFCSSFALVTHTFRLQKHSIPWLSSSQLRVTKSTYLLAATASQR